MARPVKVSFFDAPLRPVEATALRNLSQGSADERLQRIAWEWILQRACRVNGSDFIPGDPHGSAFLQGRREVGRMILNAARTTPEAAAKLEELTKGEQP